MIKITRSFSLKRQAKQFEPVDWFCAAETEVEEKDAKKMSKKLAEFCQQQVEEAEYEYFKPKVESKFDENAPANIKEDPVWLKYKKPYDKLHFAGNKDIAETEKQAAELGTEELLTEEEGIS